VGKIHGYTEGEIIDLEGDFLLPGFIDVHIQGAGGADILDEDEEAIRIISEVCARCGVTGFLATTVYKPGLENRHFEKALKGASKGLREGEVSGIPFGGPVYLKGEKRDDSGILCLQTLCESPVGNNW